MLIFFRDLKELSSAIGTIRIFRHIIKRYFGCKWFNRSRFPLIFLFLDDVSSFFWEHLHLNLPFTISLDLAFGSLYHSLKFDATFFTSIISNFLAIKFCQVNIRKKAANDRKRERLRKKIHLSFFWLSALTSNWGLFAVGYLKLR